MIRNGAGLELLVGGAEFWGRARPEIESARARVLVQTLSFESDHSGRALTSALLRARAPDRRLAVDAFNELFHSDRLLLKPANLRNRELRREVLGTRRMTARLERAGVRVRTVHPLGFLGHRIADRNHKKVIVVDERAAYVGGINFSAHNFAWHDQMLRIESRGAVSFLAQDFDGAWQGRAGPLHHAEPGLEIFNLPGPGNHRAVQPVLQRIASARHSIFVESPYLAAPFTDAMADARAHGAAVTVLTPAENNRSFQTAYITAVARRHGFELRLRRGGMSHLKAMLLDGRELLLGSSNFDWPSADRLPEYIAAVGEPGLLAAFRERVLEPDLAQSDVIVAAGPPCPGPLQPVERQVALIRRLAKWSCGGEYGHYLRRNGSSGS